MMSWKDLGEIPLGLEWGTHLLEVIGISVIQASAAYDLGL
jgi:hypothetical protein